MVVEFGRGDFAGLDCLLEIIAVEEFAGLFVIEAGGGSLFRAVGATPVGEHESLEVPVFLQQVGEQIFVFAGVVAPDAVVGAHHRGDVGFLQSNFEREQVALAGGAFVDGDVDRVAAALLIVEGVMLDVADDVLRLQALHDRSDHLSGQNGIFAEIFEGAAVARFAGEVDAAAERHVVALSAQFAADQRSVFVAGFEIPTRGAGHIRGQRGGVAAILAAAANAVGGVRHLDGGNAEARNAGRISGAAVGLYGQRAHRTQAPHASAVQQSDLLVERHLLDDQRGALVRREAGVAPGMSLAALRLRGQESNTEDEDAKSEKSI